MKNVKISEWVIVFLQVAIMYALAVIVNVNVFSLDGTARIAQYMTLVIIIAISIYTSSDYRRYSGNIITRQVLWLCKECWLLAVMNNIAVAFIIFAVYSVFFNSVFTITGLACVLMSIVIQVCVWWSRDIVIRKYENDKGVK